MGCVVARNEAGLERINWQQPWLSFIYDRRIYTARTVTVADGDRWITALVGMTVLR